MRLGVQEVATHSPRSHRLAVALALERAVLLRRELEVLKLPLDSKPIGMSHIQNHMAGHLQMSSVTPHKSHTKAREKLTCRSDCVMCEVLSSKSIVEFRPYSSKWEHVQLALWRTYAEAKVISTRHTSVWCNIVWVLLLPEPPNKPPLVLEVGLSSFSSSFINIKLKCETFTLNEFFKLE